MVRVVGVNIAGELAGGGGESGALEGGLLHEASAAGEGGGDARAGSAAEGGEDGHGGMWWARGEW